MSPVLRIELILLAITFLFIVVRNVNKRNLQLKYSLIWILASVILVVMAFSPRLVFRVTHFLGIETPSNFIFLLSIIWLIGMNLSLTVIVSRQSDKIKRTIQMISIENYERNKAEKLYVKDEGNKRKKGAESLEEDY